MNQTEIIYEYGVKRNNVTNLHNYYINFSGIGMKDYVLFWEIATDGIRITEVNLSSLLEVHFLISHINEQENIIDIKQNSDGDVFILFSNPIRLVKYNIEYDFIITQTCFADLFPSVYPVSLNICDNEILITAEPGYLLVIDSQELTFKFKINTFKDGLLKPSFAKRSIIFGDDLSSCYYIVDSSHQIVCCYNKNSRVVWSYGKINSAGINKSELNAPLYIDELGGRIIISEQRNHCVSILSPNYEILKIFGEKNYVGTEGGKLWAPNGFIYENKLYIALCKGASICIFLFNELNNKLERIYGVGSIHQSVFNFQRSCYFDDINNEVIVADTYHNRIISFGLNGEILYIVSNISLYGNLLWPRAALIYDNLLYIADSRHQCIVVCTRESKFIKKINLNQFDMVQMIQSIQIDDDKLLVAFETFFVILNIKNEMCIYDSRKIRLDLCDMHHALMVLKDVIISDAGNGRIVIFSEGSIRYLYSLIYKDSIIKLVKPKCCFFDNGMLYIVDSAKSSIYAVIYKTNKVKYIYGGYRGCGNHLFSKPRWISQGPENNLLISDTDNHRVVLVKKLEDFD